MHPHSIFRDLTKKGWTTLDPDTELYKWLQENTDGIFRGNYLYAPWYWKTSPERSLESFETKTELSKTREALWNICNSHNLYKRFSAKYLNNAGYSITETFIKNICKSPHALTVLGEFLPTDTIQQLQTLYDKEAALNPEK